MKVKATRRGGRLTAETGNNGYYSLDLKPLGKGGYEAQISHPDLGGQWYDASNSAVVCGIAAGEARRLRFVVEYWIL